MIAANWLTSTHLRRRLDEENITIKYKVERIVWYLIISYLGLPLIQLNYVLSRCLPCYIKASADRF